ncbi:MAG: hypothetical protein WB511_15125 [Nitrososphaeraceae archaeon]
MSKVSNLVKNAQPPQGREKEVGHKKITSDMCLFVRMKVVKYDQPLTYIIVIFSFSIMIYVDNNVDRRLVTVTNAMVTIS